MKRSIIAVSLALAIAAPAQAYDYNDFVQNTRWVHISDNTREGAKISGISQNFNSVALSGDDHSYNADKYKVKYTDWEAGFITKVTDTLAVNWTVSTGSPAEKIRVQPSLRLGFTKIFGIQQNAVKRKGEDPGVSYFALSASHKVGGRTAEQTCVDDTDRIFNCRTSQSIVDTPVMNSDPINRNTVMLQYVLTW